MMILNLKKILFLFCLLVCFVNKTYTQNVTAKPETDSFGIIRERFLNLANNNQLDSALYFGKILDQLAIRECGSASEERAGVLYYLGEVYRLKGDFHEAYNCFKQSVKIFDVLDTIVYIPGFYPLAVARTGFMCEQFGAAQEEKIYFEKAIALNNKLKPNGYTESNEQMYLVLANHQMYNGEYEKADSIYSLIKKILDTLPQSAFNLYLQASLYGDKANIYNETGNYEKCLQYTKEALKLEHIAQDSGYADNDYVQVCLNLSEVYASAGDTQNAWKACKQAEDSFAYIHNNSLPLQIIKTKAFLYQQQNDYDEAAKLNTEFLRAADTLPQLDGYFPMLVNLGVLYTETKQYAKADSLFRKEIHVLQDTGLIYSYSMLQARKGLCINLIQQKKYGEALDSIISLIQFDFDAMSRNFESMSEADKLNYQSDADKVFDLLYICMHNQQSLSQEKLNRIYKAELQRKGLVLRSQLAAFNALRNSTDTSVINLYNAWLNNKQILSNQYSLPYSQRLFKIDSLEEVNEELEKQLAGNTHLTFQPGAAIFNLTPPDSVANIEFIRYNYKSLTDDEKSGDSAFYAAFITTADTLPRYIELCSEKQLLNLIKDKKGNTINEDQLTQKIYDKQSIYSKVLYKLIWQKLDIYLTNIKNINYSTSGLLNNIAFPAVFNGKGYLMNRFTFNRFFNLQPSFSDKNIAEKTQQVNIWGNINYDSAYYNTTALKRNADTGTETFASTVASLAGGVKNISNKPLHSINESEVQHLKKLFGDNKLATYSIENSAATEENFKQQSSSFSGILHISTHGFYTAYNQSHSKSSLPSDYISATINPLFRCGLAFAGVNYYWKKGVPRKDHDDGILTGYEISQLDLHKVDLVTLSACETGLGDVTDNEGDLGLQRAFKIAGVHNMLVSLWQVPAKQTDELLTLFYTNLLNHQTYSEALRSAELAMQKNYPPYYWAGFVLIQ